MAAALNSQQIMVREEVAPDPYASSWLDRLTASVDRLPGPAWLVYLLTGVLVLLLFTVLKWVDGTFPVGHVELYHLVFVGTPLYALAVLHLLDQVAGQALEDFRPVLITDAATVVRLRYQLTTLPATPALVVTLGCVVSAFLVWWNVGDVQEALAARPWAFLPITALEAAITLSTWVLAGLFIYHTVHQLRTVTAIYAEHTRINLFTLGPLYTFSRLTALTAIAPMPLFLVDYLGWPGQGNEPITTGTLGLWGLFGLLSVCTFVLPLLGVRRLLAQERAQAQLDLAARLRTLLAGLHQQVSSGAASADSTTATKNLLDSLLAEQGLLNKVSSWPWAPETPRALATALLLPVLVVIISELVKRLFGL